MRRILSFELAFTSERAADVRHFEGDKAVIAAAFTLRSSAWYGAAFMLTMAPAMIVTSALQSLLFSLSPCRRARKVSRALYTGDPCKFWSGC
jgi:hypothetical protein